MSKTSQPFYNFPILVATVSSPPTEGRVSTSNKQASTPLGEDWKPRGNCNAIFHDLSGKRQAYFRFTVVALMLSLLIGITVFLASLKHDPKFPDLLLSKAERLADFSEISEIARGDVYTPNTPYDGKDEPTYREVRVSPASMGQAEASSLPLLRHWS